MEIDIETALQRDDLQFIDVRSPLEFEEASIPEAVNIPLFNDQEHHELGIIYHHDGEAAARKTALKIISPKLPSLVDQIMAACGDKTPLLYCQRGGMRSLSLYRILELTGVRCFRLHKGYKAFRKHVNKSIANYTLNSDLYVLNGLTGVGKTVVLHKLKKRGYPVIDLEGLACHHGSVFGAIGYSKPRSQKDFDALLLKELDLYKDTPFILIEGEGRRIGDIYIPDFLMKAMENGQHVLLTASLESRAKRIVKMYTGAKDTGKNQIQLIEALCALERRIGLRKVESLTKMVKEERYHQAAEMLCKDYYDHFYDDSKKEKGHFIAQVESDDSSTAVEKIIEIINLPKAVDQ